jgi:hypothetical protein
MYLEKMKIGEITNVNEMFYSTLPDETKSKFQLKHIGNGYVELTRVSKRYQTQSVRKTVLEKLANVGLEKVTFDNIDLASLRVHVSAYNRKNNDVFIVRENQVFRDINKAMTLKSLSQKLYDLIEMDIYSKMKDLQYKIVDFNIMSPLPFEGIKDKVKQFEESKINEVVEVVQDAPETIEHVEELENDSKIMEVDFEDENEFED